MLLAVDDGPLINLVNTPIMDGQAYKLLTVEVLMVSLLLYFCCIVEFLRCVFHYNSSQFKIV